MTERRLSTAEKEWSSARLRERFLCFFEENGHRRVASASLVPPAGDQSLLFTTAGMVQFKSLFLDPEKSEDTYTDTGKAAEASKKYSGERMKRACSVQKCLRAGGKHNDIEEVGTTARHLTFFEMLGSFSFGDYGKAEAISWAWQLLTDKRHGLGLEKERLRVTVHEKDDETAALWKQLHGVAAVRLGADNWWSLGDDVAGLPAGYCTELFYDTGIEGQPHVDRWVEVWNLVFMQYRTTGAPSQLRPLARTSVDTGMGLERLAAVMQGCLSSFETDCVAPLVRLAWRASGMPGALYGTFSTDLPAVSARVMADHLRASCFLVSDGVLPSAGDRGYVLRRLLRRSFAAGRVHLSLSPQALQRLIPEVVQTVVQLMGPAYPQLAQHHARITQVLQSELLAFEEVTDGGMALLSSHLAELRRKGSPHVSPEMVFRLHDALGFPLDMTRAVAAKEGLSIDLSAVELLMEQQRARGRASAKRAASGPMGSAAGSGDLGVPAAMTQECEKRRVRSRFTGHDGELTAKSRLLAVSPDPGDANRCWIAIDLCPFYPRGGGQSGDRGKVVVTGGLGVGQELEVLDTMATPNGAICLHLQCAGEEEDGWLGRFSVGETQVSCHVAEEVRTGSSCNHTATHLLHSALSMVLNQPVQQAGSAVHSDRLRFDFSLGRPMTSTEVERVEALVTSWIFGDLPLQWYHTSLETALQQGAKTLPGEQYGEQVRVVQVGDGQVVSAELCGGTHVPRTSRIGLFKILSESSTAAGIRRIEAVTGPQAMQWYREQVEISKSLCTLLGSSSPYGLAKSVQKLMDQNAELSRQLTRLMAQMAQQASHTPSHVIDCTAPCGLRVFVFDFEPDLFPPKTLRKHAHIMVPRRPHEINLLLSGSNFICLSSPADPLLPASSFIAALIKAVGGAGGGPPHLCQGKFESVSSIVDAIKSLRLHPS